MQTRNGSDVHKPNRFYVGYNNLTKEVLPDTLYRYKADTYAVMSSTFGEDWEESRPYFTVKLCEVCICDLDDEGNNH